MTASSAYATINAGFQRGPLSVLPDVEITTGYNDNVLFANSARITSPLTTLRLGIQTEIETGTRLYTLSYGGKLARYVDSAADNYFDNTLVGNARLAFGNRGTLGLKLQYTGAHEPRGAGYSAGIGRQLNEPDIYSIVNFGSSLTYGGNGATGRIVVDIDGQTRRYQSRREITRERDRNRIDTGVTLFYRVMPKTSLLLQGIHSQFNYLHPRLNNAANNLDSTEQRYLIGATWKATAITEGTVKLGRADKSFDVADRGQFIGLSWEVEILWSPLSYTTVQLETSAQTRETNFGRSDFIEERLLQLRWQHDWGDRISSRVQGTLIRYDYEPNIRRDNVVTFDLQLDYAFHRQMTITTHITRQQRWSSVDQWDYFRHIGTIGIKANW